MKNKKRFKIGLNTVLLLYLLMAVVFTWEAKERFRNYMSRDMETLEQRLADDGMSKEIIADFRSAFWSVESSVSSYVGSVTHTLIITSVFFGVCLIGDMENRGKRV